jgi:hypothetical protein
MFLHKVHQRNKLLPFQNLQITKPISGLFVIYKQMKHAFLTLATARTNVKELPPLCNIKYLYKWNITDGKLSLSHILWPLRLSQK